MNTNEYNKTQEIEGQIGEQVSSVDPLLLDVSDEDILAEIDDRLKESLPVINKLREDQKKGNKYYDGEQLDQFTLQLWQLPAVENRIYVSIEVLIPIITANPGDPDIRALIVPPGMEDIVEDYVDTLTSMCLYDYSSKLKIKDKVRLILRDLFTSKMGVGKFRYDNSIKQIVFEYVDPMNIYVPTENTPKGWVIEYIGGKTLRELMTEFPESKEKLQKKFFIDGKKIPEAILGTRVGYYAYWTNTFCAYKLDDIILDKKKNPHWDWSGENVIVGEQLQETSSGAVNVPIVEKYRYNVLNYPRHPYFILTYNRYKDLDFERTTSLFQSIPLQDLINDRKRQIHKVSSDTGIIIASGDAISEATFRKWDGSPNSTFWAKAGVDITRAFHRLPGAEVSASSMADLQDSRAAIDNIFGTQNATRGVANSASESGEARKVLREGDMTRSTPISEAIEAYLQEVYMYLIQMRMMFTREKYDVPNPNPTESGDYRNNVFDRSRIPMVKVSESFVVDGKEVVEEYMKPLPITLTVRGNSTLPKDPVSEYQRALTLTQAGLLDPLSAMEQMGITNPSAKLTRLLKWQLSPMSLLPESKRAEIEGMAGGMGTVDADAAMAETPVDNLE